MAITLLVSANTPNPNVIGDWALMAAQVTACKQLLNTNPQILTEWETTTVPEIAKGTYIQHLGAIYIVDTANFPIAAGALAVGVNYIAITGAAGAATLSAAWVIDISGYAWDYENNGLYNGTSQLLPYAITYDGAASYIKYKIMNLSTKNAGDFILVDSDGESISDITTTGAISGNSIETDGTALRTKVIEIGDWNMDTTSSVIIPHGIDYTAIRAINVIIRRDDARVYGFASYQNAASDLLLQEIVVTSTNVALVRDANGDFDNANYTSTPFNRGFITITYEA